MANLVIWLAASICLLLVLGKKRIHWYWAIVMAAYVLVPNMARGVYFPLLHPAAWSVIVGYLFNMVVYPQRVYSWLMHSRYLVFSMLGIIILVSSSVFSPYSGGLKSVASFLLVVILCPVLLSVAIRGTLKVDPRREKVYLWIFMLTMVFESVLGLIQYQEEELFFYQEAYASLWFSEVGESLSRAVGTTGHGMQLAALLVVAVALTLRIPSVFLRLSLSSLFILTIPSTNARAQLITGMFVYAVVLFVSIRQKFAVAVPMGILSIVGILEYVNSSEAGQELLNKFEADGGSAQKRVQAYQWFATHMGEMVWQGYPGSRATRESGILTSSLENGYFMLALHFGIVLMVLYAIIQISVVANRLLAYPRLNFPAVLAAVVTMATSLNSSSFMAESVEGPFVWILLGLASISPVETKANAQGQDEPLVEPVGATAVRRPVAIR